MTARLIEPDRAFTLKPVALAVDIAVKVPVSALFGESYAPRQ